MNPRGVFEFARLVEVEDEIARQHVARIVADHNGTPGCLARCLHGTLQTCSVRRQMADKREGLWQGIGRWQGIRRIFIAAALKFGGQCLGFGINQFQMHGGIVGTGCFVDIDIQSVGRLHLQRGLHTCW